MRHQLARAAGTALIAAGLLTPATVITLTPAAATTGDCKTITVNDPTDIISSGGGTATLVDDGVIMSTPEQASKVSYRRDLHAPVPLSHITALSYRTDRQPTATGVDSTVAAYKLGVDANGDNTVDGTLVYEPYYNGTVTTEEQAHDALGVDGAGKWWYSAEPGNKQTLATFKQWTNGTGPVAFPAPEARWFGVEQGTYNTGAITLVSRVKIKSTGLCKIVEFTCPKPTTKPTTTLPTTVPTTTVPTTQPTTTRPTTTAPTTTPPVTTEPPPPIEPTPTETTPPPAGGSAGSGDSLPLTGTSIGTAVVSGAVLVAAGIALLVISRRRRARYVA